MFNVSKNKCIKKYLLYIEINNVRIEQIIIFPFYPALIIV